MRKSIDSLSALVTHAFDLDPFSDAWFVFCNRGRDKLKILRWDRNGFWLYYRRLEKVSVKCRPYCRVLYDVRKWKASLPRMLIFAAGLRDLGRPG